MTKFTADQRKDVDNLVIFLQNQIDKNPDAKRREFAWKHLVAIETLLLDHDGIKDHVDQVVRETLLGILNEIGGYVGVGSQSKEELQREIISIAKGRQ